MYDPNNLNNPNVANKSEAVNQYSEGDNKNKNNKIIIILLIAIILGLGTYIVYGLISDNNTNNTTDNTNTDNNNTTVTYKLEDYVSVAQEAIASNEAFSQINVQRVGFKNLPTAVTSDFIDAQQNLIDMVSNDVVPSAMGSGNTITSEISKEVNGSVLSIKYDLVISEVSPYDVHNVLTANIDLATNKALTIAELFTKYSKSLDGLANKLFADHVYSASYLDQKYTDAVTGEQLTQAQINAAKATYVERIKTNISTIASPYIKNGKLYVSYRPIDVTKNCIATYKSGPFTVNAIEL